MKHRRTSGQLPETLDMPRSVLSTLVDHMKKDGSADALWRSTVDRVCGDQWLDAGLPATPSTLVGRDAFELLLQLHEYAIRWAVRLAQRFSPVEWLFYLRRAEGVFGFNQLPSTAVYSQILAEAVTLRSRARPPAALLGETWHTYPVDAGVARAVVQFAEAIALVYVLQGRLRWAGKRCPIHFVKGSVPQEQPTEDLETAVRMYDRRAGGNVLAPLGIVETYPSGISALSEGAQGFPLWTFAGDVRHVSLPHLGARFEASTVFEVLRVKDAAHLALLSPQLGAADISLLALLAGSLAPEFVEDQVFAQALNVGYVHGSRESLNSWIEWGLAAIRDGVLDPLVDRAAVPSDAIVAAQELERLEACLWPPRPGTPLRRSRRGITIDLVSTSWAFQTRLRDLAVVGGQDANVRAQTFEEQVQTLLDGTKYAPRENWRSLRGRTLRVDGRAVTDIDALFESGGALVAINCKSVPESDAIERSDPATADALAARIRDDLSDWIAKVEILRTQPKGDNFDFSDATTIHPAVVYPRNLFVEVGPATNEILPGLPTMFSASELWGWASEGKHVISVAEARALVRG